MRHASLSLGRILHSKRSSLRNEDASLEQAECYGQLALPAQRDSYQTGCPKDETAPTASFGNPEESVA